MNSYAKFGGAARRHFSAICEKPMGGAHMCPPPGRARVKAGLTSRCLSAVHTDILEAKIVYGMLDIAYIV